MGKGDMRQDGGSTSQAGGRVAARGDHVTRLVARVDAAWAALQDSCADLSDERMTEPGVAGDWSVKDVLAHVTTWEEEALRHLPTILAGGRPPRYAAVGGIDAFNARTAEQNRRLSLADVRMRLEETH